MDDNRWTFVDIDASLSFDRWWQTTVSSLNEADKNELCSQVSDDLIQRIAWAHALQPKRGEIPVFVFDFERVIRVYPWSLEHARTRKNTAIVLYHLDAQRQLSSLQCGKRSVFDAGKPYEFPEPMRRLLLRGKFWSDDENVRFEPLKRRREIMTDSDSSDDGQLTGGHRLRKRPESSLVPVLDLEDPRYNLPISPTDSDRSDSTESSLLSSNSSDDEDVVNDEEYEEEDDIEKAPWDLQAMLQPFLLGSYATIKRLFPTRLYPYTSNVILSILLRWKGTQPWEVYLRQKIDKRLRYEPDFETNMTTVQEIWRSIDRERIKAQADQGDVSEDEEDTEQLQFNDKWEQVYEIVISRFNIDPGSIVRMLQFFDQFINDTYPTPRGVDITVGYQNAKLESFLQDEGLIEARQIANYFRTQVVPYMEEHYREFVNTNIDTSAAENLIPSNRRTRYTATDLIFRRPPKSIRNRFQGRESMADVLGTKDTLGNPTLSFLEARRRLDPDHASERLFNTLTDIQRAVVDKVMSSYGQLVVAHTGFGKTLCMLMIAAKLLTNGQRVIIAVKKSTLDQFQSKIREYFSGSLMNELLDTVVTHYDLQNGNGLNGINIEKVSRDLDSANLHVANDSQIEIEVANDSMEDTDVGKKKGILGVRGAILLIDECHLYATAQFTTAKSKRDKIYRYQSMTTYKVMLQCASASRVYLFTATPCRNDGNDLLSLLCMVKRMAPTPKQFNAMTPLLKYGFTDEISESDDDEPQFGIPEIQKIRGFNPIDINWRCLVTSVRSEIEDESSSGFARLKTSIERVMMSDTELALYNQTEEKGWGPWGRNLLRVSDTDTKLLRGINLIIDHLRKFEQPEYRNVRDRIKPRVLIYVELRDTAEKVLKAVKKYVLSADSVYIRAGEFKSGRKDLDAFADVRSNTKICIVTEAGITGFDPPPLTLIIAMNNFWSPSTKLQLEGRLVRRDKHKEFVKAKLPTIFRVITLQAVRTIKRDRSLMLEFANITRADQLAIIKSGRKYTYDERQQAQILKKAAWIRAAVLELHRVSLLDTDCKSEFERRSSISRPIITTRGVFLSNYTPARRVSAPLESIQALAAPLPARRVLSAPHSLNTRQASMTPPQQSVAIQSTNRPVEIEVVDGMDTIVNPSTNRRVGIDTRLYRELVRKQIIKVIDKRTT